MLKEIQVLAAGTIGFDSGPQPVNKGEVLHQEDPDFCSQYPVRGEIRQRQSADDDAVDRNRRRGRASAAGRVTIRHGGNVRQPLQGGALPERAVDRRHRAGLRR